MTNWFSTNWGYRKQHTIAGASGAGTNYQISVNVHFGSGTDNSADVYLNGKCKDDFSDIRFTASDGITLLNYWIESKTVSNIAKVWVKVQEDLGSNRNVYIYYGNPSAVDASNGSNTFNFFDDFSDLSKWTVSHGTWTATNSILTGIDAAYGGSVQITSPPSGSTRRVRQSFKYSDFNSQYESRPLMQSGTDFLANQFIPNNYLRDVSYVSTWGTTYDANPTWDNSKFYTLETDLFNGAVKTLYNDSQTQSFTDSSWNQTWTGLGIGLIGGSTGTIYVDWLFIAKYVSPEPSHSTWNAEEDKVTITIPAFLTPVSDAQLFADIQVINGGSGYTTAPTITIDPPPSGTTATATATLTGPITGIVVTNGGSNYTSVPSVNFSGGGGSGLAAYAIINTSTKQVTGVNITNQGYGYTTSPSISFSGGGGSGAAAYATMSVTGVTITNGGTGYTSIPNVSFSSPSYAYGARATGMASLTGQSVSSILLTGVLPTDSSPIKYNGYISFIDTNHGYGANLFLVISQDYYAPLLATDQGFIVKKDLQVGGYLGSGQGALWLNHGLVGKPILASPPCIQMMDSGIPYPYGTSFPSPADTGQLFNHSTYGLRMYSGNPSLAQNGWITGQFTGFYDTLFLLMADGITPANLDSGNVSAHGYVYANTLSPYSGGVVTITNDLVEQGTLHIRNLTPVLDLDTGVGNDPKGTFGFDGTNNYLVAYAGNLNLNATTSGKQIIFNSPINFNNQSLSNLPNSSIPWSAISNPPAAYITSVSAPLQVSSGNLSLNSFSHSYISDWSTWFNQYLTTFK